MRAITVRAFGDPSTLTLEDLPVPAPGPGQVLVRVAAAGVGPWDVKARKGLFGPRKFPYVPGAEASGTIDALGEGVITLSVGDRVYGSPSGAYAEVASADVAKVAPAPPSIDLVDAAAVPVGAVTALEGIDDHLALGPGDRLLVAGAAGGVGAFVVQLAKARGASVIGTALPDNHEFLRDIGADRVLDYRDDWVALAGEVDATYDCVGGATWEGCVSALRPGGRGVTIAALGSPVARADVRLSNFSASVTGARLSEVAGFLDSGQVKVAVSRRFLSKRRPGPTSCSRPDTGGESCCSSRSSAASVASASLHKNEMHPRPEEPVYTCPEGRVPGSRRKHQFRTSRK